MSTEPRHPAPARRPLDVVDRGALLRSVAATVVGGAVFLYGYSGGRGPVFLGPGWLMIIGGALLAYAVLTLLRLTLLRRRMDLTPEELQRWGKPLELATGAIVDACQAGKPVARIAAEVEKEHGVPPEVTLKYIIALGRYSNTEQGQ